MVVNTVVCLPKSTSPSLLESTDFIWGFTLRWGLGAQEGHESLSLTYPGNSFPCQQVAEDSAGGRPGMASETLGELCRGSLESCTPLTRRSLQRRTRPFFYSDVAMTSCSTLNCLRYLQHKARAWHPGNGLVEIWKEPGPWPHHWVSGWDTDLPLLVAPPKFWTSTGHVK